MRPHVLRRRLSVYWRRRPLRAAAALLALAAVLALDSYLIAPLFDPRIDGQTPNVQQIYPGEELWLTEFLPAGDSLDLDAGAGLYVALWFPAARLSADLRTEWSRSGLEIPPDPLQAIEYTFGQSAESAESAKPCATALHLTPEGSDGPLTLRLDQGFEPLKVQGMLPLRLIPVGGDLHVQVDDFADSDEICRRLLRIGEIEVYDPRQLAVTVPSGRSIEMAFLQAGGAGVVEPFDLDQLPGVRQLEILSPPSSALHVRSAAEAPSIRVRKLRVASEVLEVTYSGEGYARGPRAPDDTKPFAKLKRGLLAYPLWILFLSAIHLALFNWLKAALVGPDGQARSRSGGGPIY